MEEQERLAEYQQNLRLERELGREVGEITEITETAENGGEIEEPTTSLEIIEL